MTAAPVVSLASCHLSAPGAGGSVLVADAGWVSVGPCPFWRTRFFRLSCSVFLSASGGTARTAPLRAATALTIPAFLVRRDFAAVFSFRTAPALSSAAVVCLTPCASVLVSFRGSRCRAGTLRWRSSRRWRPLRIRLRTARRRSGHVAIRRGAAGVQGECRRTAGSDSGPALNGIEVNNAEGRAWCDTAYGRNRFGLEEGGATGAK